MRVTCFRFKTLRTLFLNIADFAFKAVAFASVFFYSLLLTLYSLLLLNIHRHHHRLSNSRRRSCDRHQLRSARHVGLAPPLLLEARSAAPTQPNIAAASPNRASTVSVTPPHHLPPPRRTPALECPMAPAPPSIVLLLLTQHWPRLFMALPSVAATLIVPVTVAAVGFRDRHTR